VTAEIEVPQEFSSGQNLIVPPGILPDDARILNLENAAAELMDNNRTVHEDTSIARVEAKEHFQRNLKVIQIGGVLEGRPVVRSESDSVKSLPASKKPMPPKIAAVPAGGKPSRSGRR